MARGTYDSDRRDYENTNVICDDVDRMPVIVNAIPKTMSDERRKPYYYNELNMMPANDLMQLASYAEESETNASTEEHENRKNGNGRTAVAVADDEWHTNNKTCIDSDSLENVV